MYLCEFEGFSVKLDGDLLRIRVGEINSKKFEMLFKAIDFALSIHSWSEKLWTMQCCNRSSKCGYFFVEDKKRGTAWVLFLSGDLKELTFNLKTGKITSTPEFFSKASRLLASRLEPLPWMESADPVNKTIGLVETHYAHFDVKSYKAILHVDRAEIEYRIEGEGQHQPENKIFPFKEVTRNGEKYLLFKEVLHPFGTFHYNLKTDEIRYDDNYKNRVAEFWKKVRRSGMRILGDDNQLKAVEMLKTKSVEEVIEWYRKRHEKMDGILSKNDEIRELYERLVAQCTVRIGEYDIAILPTNYTTLVIAHDGTCDVLTFDRKAVGWDWILKKRDVYKFLRRLYDGNCQDAIRVAEESGAVKLDGKTAGELLAEELRQIKNGLYVKYVFRGGRPCRMYNSEFKNIANWVIGKLPSDMKRNLLSEML